MASSCATLWLMALVDVMTIQIWYAPKVVADDPDEVHPGRPFPNTSLPNRNLESKPFTSETCECKDWVFPTPNLGRKDDAKGGSQKIETLWTQQTLLHESMPRTAGILSRASPWGNPRGSDGLRDWLSCTSIELLWYRAGLCRSHYHRLKIIFWAQFEFVIPIMEKRSLPANLLKNGNLNRICSIAHTMNE